MARDDSEPEPPNASRVDSDIAQPHPAQADLVQTVYAHLRAIAQSQLLNERRGHTLTATALVHEAFLRLNPQSDSPAHSAPTSRPAFLYAAGEAMRRILIEHARARNRIKRGGGAVRVSLDAIGDIADLAAFDADNHDNSDTLLAFDDAFRRLEEHEPEVAAVVRLRFYAGLSVAETAAAIGVSERTVNNRWLYARAWLARTLQNPQPIDH